VGKVAYERTSQNAQIIVKNDDQKPFNVTVRDQLSTPQLFEGPAHSNGIEKIEGW
jgi:hypothetical protein